MFHPGSVLTPNSGGSRRLQAVWVKFAYVPFASFGEGAKLSFLFIAELAGAFPVYLTTERAKYLNGESASVNWDVEELVTRRENIVWKGFFPQE